MINYQTNEELIEAIKQANDNEQKELYSDLYQRNYGLIKSICRNYTRAEEQEDLEQQAFFGLKTAVEKYDASKGKFSTYAAIWIKQCLIRYIENNSSLVKIPAYIRNDCLKYFRAIAEYQKLHGTDPSDQEIAKLLNITSSQLIQLKKNAMYMSFVSLAAPQKGYEDEGITLEDSIPDTAAEEKIDSITEKIDRDILASDLWQIVNTLGDEQAEVIKRRYQDCMTLDQIGKEININRGRVQQIQFKALNALRKSANIRKYRDEYLSYCRAYSGTGLQAFLNTGYSSVEKVAIENFTGKINGYQKKVDRKTKLINARYEQVPEKRLKH